MPGNIHKAKPHATEVEKSESQIDRYAAALFFFQPVWIGPRKSFNQRGFAVVDMSGRARDYVLDFIHGGIAMRTLMLAKRGAIGQMPRRSPHCQDTARNNGTTTRVSLEVAALL